MDKLLLDFENHFWQLTFAKIELVAHDWNRQNQIGLPGAAVDIEFFFQMLY